MQVILPIEQILVRAKRIGLGTKALAASAGIAEATMYRSANFRMNTIRQLTAALETHEIALRDHLLALHPVEPVKHKEAAE